MFEQLMFYFFATLAVIAGIFVISAKNPISSAISLVVTLGAVAVLFVLQDAHFVATIQVLVYAGAIMVLFVFVIMLLNLHPQEMLEKPITSVKITAGVLSVAAAALLLSRFLKVGGEAPAVSDDYGTLEAVGMHLFTQYLIPFEVISVLLTAAVVGAVVIAKRDL